MEPPSFDELAFLKVIANGEINWKQLQVFPELNLLKQLLAKKPPKTTLSADDVIQLLMHEKIKELAPKMAAEQFGRVTVGESVDVNWIRTDSIFVTVISKDYQPEKIPGLLLDALVNWNPPPHRLIMSKMRNVLDQHGAVAEVVALDNRHLQAGWLTEVLEANKPRRKTNVRLGLQRHWESLGGNINGRVAAFADNLSDFLAAQDRQTVLRRFDDRGAVGEQEKVHLALNCHVCSKKVEGHHLITGHILCVGAEHWLCLTPACDLQPEQSNGWGKKLGEWIPFKAIQILRVQEKEALKNSHRGTYLFLSVDGEVSAFSFQNGGPVTEQTQTAKWEQWFAGNQGRFDESCKMKVAMIRGNAALVFEEKDAIVVAQLRYEYALNLTNRLGAHLSRVGLDFKSYQA